MGRSPSPFPVAGDRYSYIRTLSLCAIKASQKSIISKHVRLVFLRVSQYKPVNTPRALLKKMRARLLLCMGEKSVCARVCVESWELVRGVWVNL